MEPNSKMIVCKFFKSKGQCPLDKNCPNEKGHKRCFPFLNGKCDRNENCAFFHDLKEHALIHKADFCELFKRTGKCYNGPSCPFAVFHKNCKYFADGDCKKGQNCPFYHNLFEENKRENEENKGNHQKNNRNIPQNNNNNNMAPNKNFPGIQNFMGIQNINNNINNNNDKKPICKYFNADGKCTKGENCKFSHQKNKEMEVCQEFLGGDCKNGNNCQKLHVCRHFLKGVCKSGEKCGFLHFRPEISDVKSEKSEKSENSHQSWRKNEKNDNFQKICEDFWKGECKYGKKCRNRHVCKHFYKGFCKNGENCTFEHFKPDSTNLKTPEKPQKTPKKEENNTEDENICCICMEKPRTHAPVPCGHMIYCEDCILRCGKTCAKCRTPITSIVKIFK